MYFPDQKIIFIHTPKTGGNFFSRCFVRFSEDRLVITPGTHQDLTDRFTIKGPNTDTKHQMLNTYQKKLGGNLQGYRVFSVARHPVERLVSLYFSPHRWMHRPDEGRVHQIDSGNISFDENDFKSLINKVPSMWIMLDADNFSGPINDKKPIKHNSGAEIHLIPFDNIQNRCKQFSKGEGFGDAHFPDRPVNTSASPKLKDKMLTDNRAKLEELIYATHHVKDLAFFA